MLAYPNIDPVIIQIGPLAVRWYGMMYLAGFAASYFLVKYQAKQRRMTKVLEEIDSLYTYLIMGLVLGARLGYVVFYNPGYYLNNPLDILAVWHGGMSFHGGLIGSITGGVLFVRKNKLDFGVLSDMVIVTAPIGLACGRFANFINAELYGRVTDFKWGMVFPGGGPLPRHPSQIYELLLEGVLLFIILWFLKDRNFRGGTLTSFFLMLYGSFRFFVEFFREPDAHLGFIVSWLTMGQVLSSFMILLGLVFLSFIYGVIPVGKKDP